MASEQIQVFAEMLKLDHKRNWQLSIYAYDDNVHALLKQYVQSSTRNSLGTLNVRSWPCTIRWPFA